MRAFRFSVCWLLAMAWLLWALPQPAPAATAVAVSDVLQLSERQPDAEAWPAVRVLHEDGTPLSLAQVRARDAQFALPDAPWANLGTQRHAVWLRVPLHVADGDGQWVMDIDYPALRQIDVSLVTDGQLMLQRRLGSSLKLSEQPLPGRTPALALQLEPGRQHVLYLRVQTLSAVIVPIQFSKPVTFALRESRRLLVQGLLAGFALALLAYSVAYGISLRSPLFGFYGLMLLGTTLFFVHLYGLGLLHLWPEQPLLQAYLSPLAVLLALAPAGVFVALALDTRQHSPRLHRALLGMSALAALSLLLGSTGLLPYALLKALASGLGLPLAAVAALASWQQARLGSRAAGYMLVGWTAYTAGGVSMVSLLYGLVPATLWTMHLFQACWLLEILAWLQVLGLHIEGVRRQAERSEAEKQALQSLAHTDALTGLPNRRGLGLALERALADCSEARALALFMLDLDGFKPVNDRLGHDAGDALLVAVAQRLRQQLRSTDLVARLGGDEFVVLVPGLALEADAMAVGRKLLQAFDAPFAVAGQHCRVGLTVGLALAPTDGRQAADLLKLADAAMYAGKQGGRHCLRRATAVGAPGADAAARSAANAAAGAALNRP